MKNAFLIKKCPFTGYPLESPKAWHYRSNTCSGFIGILNQKIVLSRAIGPFTLEDVLISINILQSILEKYASPENKIIIIHDYSDIGPVHMAGRKAYIDFFKRNQSLFEIVIFHNVSPFLKFSISIAKKLYNFGFTLMYFRDYESVMTHLVRNRIIEVKKKRIYTKENYCRECGLKISESMDWSNIRIENNLHADFKFIGKNILLSKISGNVEQAGLTDFFKHRTAVLESFLTNEEPFFEICDYSALTGTPPKAFRIKLGENISKDSQRLIGYIAFNVNFLMKMNLRVFRQFFQRIQKL